MQDWAFDPDAVRAVMLAFIMACHELNATQTSCVIKSMIARRIVAHAQRGERSAERLCRRAVEEVLPRPVSRARRSMT
jgi:predicted GNAT family N-acyltransferase